MEKIKKILIGENTYYWRGGDLHTKDGMFKAKALEKAKSKIKSKSKKEFYILEPGFNDSLRKIKRAPQIIMQKDIGLILSNTNIDKNSIVLDAGTGSGALAANLARFVKKVYSYEIKKDFYELAKENFEFLGLNNIELKNNDVYKKITEKNLDLIVLDLPEPHKAINNCYKSLKKGSFLVCYLPSLTQVYELLKNIQNKFILIKISELNEREWLVEERRIRPLSNSPITAFLVFLRKI